MNAPSIRTRRCAYRDADGFRCAEKFVPRSISHKACVEHAIEVSRAERIKRERREDRAKKIKLKRRADWIADAQTAINALVRYRDKDKGCFSCGKPFQPNKPGGSFDAGHYLSRGAAPHLRFNLNNIHGQCKACNKPGGATRNECRAGVIARIGVAAVEALESDQSSPKWSITDLIAIRDDARAKLKELKKERGE